MAIVNTEIISHPLNWLIVGTMGLITLILLHFVLSGAIGNGSSSTN